MTQRDNIIVFPAQTDPLPLRRPRLLIRAARHGQRGWRRSRDLPKLLKCDDLPVPLRALPRLRAEETALNLARLQGAAEYDLGRHVVLLIAILAEMRAVAGDMSAAERAVPA